jgi:hypothetical protein
VLYREIIAVCSEIHTKHIQWSCLMLNVAVHKVTIGCSCMLHVQHVGKHKRVTVILKWSSCLLETGRNFSRPIPISNCLILSEICTFLGGKTSDICWRRLETIGSWRQQKPNIRTWYLKRFRKIATSNFVISLCAATWNSLTRLDGFSCSFIFEYFSKLCRKHSSFFEI